MIYLVAGLALLGCVAIATSRRCVEARPMCPNCGRALPSFETDRCPECLLWQPPGRDKPRYVWQRYRLTLGLLMMVLPVFAWLLVPLVIRETFSPAPVKTPPPALLPGFLTAHPLPPALQGLTSDEIAQLRSLGYLPSPWGTTMPTTTKPAGVADLSPAVLDALRSAGYLSKANDPEAADSGETAASEPAGDEGP